MTFEELMADEMTKIAAEANTPAALAHDARIREQSRAKFAKEEAARLEWEALERAKRKVARAAAKELAATLTAARRA